MEEAVGVGSHAGRGKRDQRAEGGRLALQRYLVEQVAVHVHVEGRVVLNQVASGLNGDRLAPSGNLQNQLDADSHRRVNHHVLAQQSEAFGAGADPVGIEWYVVERKLAGRVGGCGLFEMADGVGEMDGCVGDDGTGRVGDGAANGPGVSALCRRGERREDQGEKGQDA